MPAVGWADVNDLLPLALACFLLGAVETVAIGRMFAAKHGGRLDSNQELLALAASNLAAGLRPGVPRQRRDVADRSSTKAAAPARRCPG